MSLIQLVCAGVITIDTIALVEKYPSEDERVIAQEISRAGGGPAAVAAVTASRLELKARLLEQSEMMLMVKKPFRYLPERALTPRVSL